MTGPFAFLKVLSQVIDSSPKQRQVPGCLQACRTQLRRASLAFQCYHLVSVTSELMMLVSLIDISEFLYLTPPRGHCLFITISAVLFFPESTLPRISLCL